MKRQPKPHFKKSHKAWYVNLNGKQVRLASEEEGHDKAMEVYYGVMAGRLSPHALHGPSHFCHAEDFGRGRFGDDCHAHGSSGLDHAPKDLPACEAPVRPPSERPEPERVSNCDPLSFGSRPRWIAYQQRTSCVWPQRGRQLGKPLAETSHMLRDRWGAQKLPDDRP